MTIKAAVLLYQDVQTQKSENGLNSLENQITIYAALRSVQPGVREITLIKLGKELVERYTKTIPTGQNPFQPMQCYDAVKDILPPSLANRVVLASMIPPAYDIKKNN